MSKSLRTIM